MPVRVRVCLCVWSHVCYFVCVSVKWGVCARSYVCLLEGLLMCGQ